MVDDRVESSDKLILELLDSARNIAVFPSEAAGADAYAAAAGLYHAIKRDEKNATFIYTGKIPENFEDIVDKQEVFSDIQKRALIVSIDYSQTPATKVHYTTKDDVLKLVLSPISSNFGLENIQTEIQGLNFDVIFTVGAQELDNYGSAYREMKDDFDAAKIINLDNTSRNQGFGSINVVDVYEPNLCLLVLNNITKWGLKVDGKAAKALLGGASKAL